jgi:hypothetical protein
LETFKAAVQNVTLAAMRRGYKRGEMDRVWGKFLVNWWKAEEVRRGELRSWFRKMSAVVLKKVGQESKGIQQAEAKKPGAQEPANAKETAGNAGQAEKEPAKETVERAAERPRNKQGNAGEDTQEKPRETVPKAQGKIWKARGDGSCLFYCVARGNSREAVARLRAGLAQHVGEHWGARVSGLDITTQELLSQVGWQKEQYMASVVTANHWGDEVELVLLAITTGQRLRVFQDQGDQWQQYAEYGTQGPLLRLLFQPGDGHRAPHYDVITTKEVWDKEQQLMEAEEARAKEASLRGSSAGKSVKDMPPRRQRSTRTERVGQRRGKARQARVWSSRGVDQQDIELLASLAHESSTDAQVEAIRAVFSHTQPWEVLGVAQAATKRECTAAFRAKSCLLHPDRCPHPRAREAFQRLGNAYQWAQDKDSWAYEKQQEKEGLRVAKAWTRWVHSGGE